MGMLCDGSAPPPPRSLCPPSYAPCNLSKHVQELVPIDVLEVIACVFIGVSACGRECGLPGGTKAVPYRLTWRSLLGVQLIST